MRNFTKFCGAIGLVLSFASQAATPYITVVSVFNDDKASFTTNLVNREKTLVKCSGYQPIYFVRSNGSCVPSPGRPVESTFELAPGEIFYINDLGKSIVSNFTFQSIEICKQVDLKLDCSGEG